MKLRNVTLATALLIVLTGCGSSGGGSNSAQNAEINNNQATQAQLEEQKAEVEKLKQQLAQAQNIQKQAEDKLKEAENRSKEDVAIRGRYTVDFFGRNAEEIGGVVSLQKYNTSSSSPENDAFPVTNYKYPENIKTNYGSNFQIGFGGTSGEIQK